MCIYAFLYIYIYIHIYLHIYTYLYIYTYSNLLAGSSYHSEVSRRNGINPEIGDSITRLIIAKWDGPVSP